MTYINATLQYYDNMNIILFRQIRMQYTGLINVFCSDSTISGTANILYCAI